MATMGALMLGAVGYGVANMIWRNFEIDDANGDALDMRGGYKYLAISMVVGITGSLAGYLLGDVACELFGFFDNYNTSLEGTANGASKVDKSGTSMFEDLFGL